MTGEETKKTHVTIIGGGPGGYAAAFRANDLGLDVTVIETQPNPGGVCLFRGCIPSKALLHVAKIITEAREAEHWGITFSKPRLNLERLRESKNSVVEKLTGGLGQLCKARGVTFIQGRADFVDSRTLHIMLQDGSEQELKTDYTILATGSRPMFLPDTYLESSRLMDSTNALDIADLPESLLVIGGGYIGLELGSVYAALGTSVTVCEMSPSLLPGVDPDLVRVLHQRMESIMTNIMLNTKVANIEEQKDGLKCRFEGKNAPKDEQVFDKVLVCIGRKPNSSGVGLRNTGVKVDERGYVKVDPARWTDDPHILAIGDIAGEPMLAHKASHEGRVAAEAVAGHNVAFEPYAIPAVVFTDPEVAYCGLTEDQAKKQGIEVKTSRFPWGASGRALTLNRAEGLTKLITDPETEQILGVGIVGSGAAELISEGVLAVEMGATAHDIGLSIHPHPTLGETIMESADLIFGQSTHLYQKPKGKKPEQAKAASAGEE
ncbi:MAG: dihydrolipoyl dehydrogenase [Candidatus Hydrogenedentota bacterium]